MMFTTNKVMMMLVALGCLALSASACTTNDDYGVRHKCPFVECYSDYECSSGNCINRHYTGDDGYCALETWMLVVVIVVSVLIFLSIIACCVCCCRRRRLKRELHIHNHYDSAGNPLIKAQQQPGPVYNYNGQAAAQPLGQYPANRIA